MSRRRVIVAFEEVQSAASRVVGQFSSPTFADGDLRGPPAGRGRFRCAADKPRCSGDALAARDTWDHTLHVGLARDVQQLLATQPSRTSAVVAEIGPERFVELLRQELRGGRTPSPTAVRASIARRAADHQALQRCLDDTLAQIDAAPR